MQAMKCDRCGNYYEKHNNVSVSSIKLTTETNGYKIYDLCDECVIKLMEFLEGGKQDEQ